MSEELAETGADDAPKGPKSPRRRTGRSLRSRRPRGETSSGESSSKRALPDGSLPAKGNASDSAREPAQVGDSVSPPGSPGGSVPTPAAESTAATENSGDSGSTPTPAGVPALPVENSGNSGPTAEAAASAPSVEKLGDSTFTSDKTSDSAPKPASSTRRRSRSRARSPRASEEQAGEKSSEVLVAGLAPAPVLPDAETQVQPAAPPASRPSPGSQTGPPQGDQGKSRVPRRRRRGSPRRDRVVPQGQGAPLKMLIAAGKDRNQIAVLQERELIEHYVSHDEDRSIVGNIYLGRVQNVLPGMEAAFLDIGEAKNAVLYAGEVSFDEEIEGPPPRIESMLKSGQAVLAQVTKDPMGSKGARLTTEVSLAGRYVVLVPGADSMGISRRLPDDERKRLRDIAGRVRPQSHGLIVRTAADGVSESDLENDIKRLVRIWSEIEEKRKNAKPPKLLYSEPDLAIRGIRDLFTADVVQVIVDDPKVYEQIRAYLTEVAPVLAERVELHEGETPLFQKFQVVDQLRKAIDRKIWLKSGGHIVIDRTEAMTVIDVNTGRFVGKSNLETTVLHANLEAAEEIAKQLRLRDIGGIIVIDFIDMMHERNRQELVRTFEASLQRDKTRTQVFNISELGLLQMTRKNVSEGLLEAFSDICEKCEGRGIILNDMDPQIKSEVSSSS